MSCHHEKTLMKMADVTRKLRAICKHGDYYVALLEKLRHELRHDQRSNIDLDPNEEAWLNKWVYIGTGDVVSPWDELEWADVRTRDSRPLLNDAFEVTLSCGSCVSGKITSIHYHRKLAAMRTVESENYAGPIHQLRSI